MMVTNSSKISFIYDLVSSNDSNSSSILGDTPYSFNRILLTLLFFTQPLIIY